MKSYAEIGIQEPEILLPNKSIDLTKWSVIACDQFTSQPEYWKAVEDFVGDSPSTLRMILPEVYLETPKEQELIQSTQNAMKAYMNSGILEPHDGFILVERTVGGKTRTGLMLALDHEAYDFSSGSQTLIRATEGTIIERLPPRIRIRKDAVLELPHILVLIDDPGRTVIEPLAAQKIKYPKAYDFELMMNSGHLTGYHIDRGGAESLVAALRQLSDNSSFHQRYQVGDDKGVLLFAIGDGNHSLATAKSIWESIKGTVGSSHPARYALVELENLHDPALQFEPIHRVLFDVKVNLNSALDEYFLDAYHLEPVDSMEALKVHVQSQPESGQTVGIAHASGFSTLTFNKPSSNLAVGTLQGFLDSLLKRELIGKIDYVHGDAIVADLGIKEGNLGFFLPAMEKNDLFKTVIVDGALPRKTFSMGEAHEKRFYMECRRIA